VTGFVFSAFAYLASAVLAVFVSRRLGLGSVVGYIVAGVLIGPVLHLADTASGYLEQLSEMGIVMMLFLIGLEIDPKMVWRLRAMLIGLGGLQVSLTIAAVTLVCLAIGIQWQQAVLFGCVAALSSTAIVLQTLGEKGMLESDGGRASFAVLLFQDLAVIPMLAFLPMIAIGTGEVSGGHGSGYLASYPGWATALITLGAVAIIAAGGHFLSRPIMRAIARDGLRDIFTAFALLVVVAIALLMSLVGLSPALGAFLGGVVLANSEFKHELQNDIEPFKGLLLGLFFITIGAKIEPTVLLQNWETVIGATVALIVIKAAVLFPLAQLFKVREGAAWLLALGLAQAGEFGFVLLSLGQQMELLTATVSSIGILVITFGMILTPALFIAVERISDRLATRAKVPAEFEQPGSGAVILAGLGRFGQIVNRMLLANGHKPVVLDYQASVVDDLRKFGVRSFFGDAGRPDLLESAGISTAKLIVVGIDDPDRTVQIVEHARRVNPRITIIARAYDRIHHSRLAAAGADHIVREVFASSIEAGGLSLQTLGMHPYEVEKRKSVFVRQDLAGLSRMAALLDDTTPAADNERFVAGFNDIGRVIQEAMLGRRAKYDEMVERGWSPPAPDDSHTLQTGNHEQLGAAK
jgi:monovalent cation:proton antiporter-2 (CPA2) family protein